MWTRFPFTTRRISMESVVKARRYGKAQTARRPGSQLPSAALGHIHPHFSRNCHLSIPLAASLLPSQGTSPNSKRACTPKTAPLSCQAPALSRCALAPFLLAIFPTAVLQADLLEAHCPGPARLSPSCPHDSMTHPLLWHMPFCLETLPSTHASFPVA